MKGKKKEKNYTVMSREDVVLNQYFYCSHECLMQCNSSDKWNRSIVCESSKWFTGNEEGISCHHKNDSMN